MSNYKTQTLETLRAHCDEVGDCWLWRGTKSAPKIKHNGQIIPARRLARALADNQEPARHLKVIATCGEAMCISPACSITGKHKTMCKAAAERGAYDNPIARAKSTRTARARSHITDDVVQQVRTATGSLSAIGKAHNISKAYAHQIRNSIARGPICTPFTGLGARQP